ncbi:PKD domain-containing protein [Aliikangiella marina]|uniref:PKD domain-containing protein n=1 Tax=Aliikangiella marina TaxID=1712262 RepID=A0A545T4R1_9GAMM|nr:PKD domain-containing protein [Aliikangiella marina]TQV72196.1 PKD domain-containing protein [Aliikangiella marina]
MTIKKNLIKPMVKFSSAILLSTGFSVAASNQENSQNIKPWVSPPVKPTQFNQDIRTLPESLAWQPGDETKNIPRRRTNPNFKPPGPLKNPIIDKNDPLIVKQKVANLTPNQRVVEQSFDGEGFTGVNPPDPTGDVGLNYYIQSINGSGGSIFSIYNKTNGARVAGPTNMDSLGSGNCASGAGDPIILFDDMAQRWLMSEFSRSGNFLCVYISQTSDPVSGGWYAYSFQSPTFPDYPKYGVGVDAYYVGTNESSPTVYALNRSAMLNGQQANFVRLTGSSLSGFGFQMLTPVDHDGTTPMPAGTPGYFLRQRDDEVHNSSANNPNEDYIELWQFNANFSNNNSSFTKVIDIPVAEFDSSLCGLVSFSCFPQSGSSSRLDPLREVVMYRAQYRNFGSYETIVGNFVTDVNGNDRGGIRWFELRRSGGGSWALHQEGTYSPDSKNRWMGSIAMDVDGNIALAYSWGSSSDFPGLRYTGRLATDSNGTMSQPEVILVSASSSVSSNRYGDYSHMALDPVDGCTFWYTGEYGRSGGQWGTYISSFKFDSCGGGTGGNQRPTASFTESCTELACNFDGTASSDPDGSIVSYAWAFGDGTTATGQTSSHTYASSGTYTVNLTVTDNEGATNSTSKAVTVSAASDSALENGVPVNNLSASTGDDVNYTLEVPAGATDIRFEISGGSGDADLYVRFGAAPTDSVYDCRPYRNGNSETCTGSDSGGTYFVRVKAYRTFSGVSLVGSYALDTSPSCQIEESFESGIGGWTTGGSCSTGTFVTGSPTEVVNGGVTTQVGGAQSGSSALFTQPNSSAGNADVDGGECTATSPTYNVTAASDVSLYYFHGQRDTGDDANDGFNLEVSVNGGSYQSLVSIGDVATNAAWTLESFSANAGDSLQLRIRASDAAGAGDLIEAGIDNLKVCAQ